MKPVAPVAAALLLATAQAGAVTLNFDDLAAGTSLSNQYAALGATFSPNAFTGDAWATNTDMTIAAFADTESGLPPFDGHVLHSFSGWLNSDGDPSFRIGFANPVTHVSMDFVSVEVPAATRLFVYDGATLLATVAGSTTGQFTLGHDAAHITSVVVTPGSFDDWVAVDNVNFTVAAVPEPGTWAMMALGVVTLLLKRRRAG